MRAGLSVAPKPPGTTRDGNSRLAISAIIAAYNEEETIADVLRALSKNSMITEIIVVSDGSIDRTVEIARSFPDVTTIALAQNQGKGCAMRLGVEHAAYDTLFFVDGDMLNLTDDHIEALVGPVVRRECDMNVGIRHRGPVRNFLHLKAHIGPVLSGIRAMRREVFASVPFQYMQRYKIELALNYFCARAGFTQCNTVIYELGHVIKESKRGMLAGVSSRLDMSKEVFLLHFDLYLFQTWRWNESEPSVNGEYELFEAIE